MLKFGINTKLNIPIITTLLLVSLIMLAIISYKTREVSEKNARDISVLQAREIAAGIKAEFEDAFNTTETLAQTLLVYRNSEDPSRETVLEIVKEVLRINENYFALWTMWEEDAFDGLDNSYARQFNQPTGRFHASVYRHQSEVLYQNFNAIHNPQLPAYVSDFDLEDFESDFYVNSKQSGKQSIIEPYYYSFTGAEEDLLFMTSVVTPIIHNNEFMGVVGVDLDLKSLKRINDISSQPDMASAIISGNGLILAHPNSLLHGQSIDSLFSLHLSESSAHAYYTQFTAWSGYFQQNALYYIIPVQFGKTVNQWSVLVEIPKSLIYKEVKHLSFVIIITSVLCFILISAIIFLLARNLTRPLKKVVGFANGIASGNFEMKIDMKRDDELGELIDALNNMSGKLNQYHTRMEELVVDRTSELNTINEELEVTNEELSVLNEELQTQHEQLELTLTELKEAQKQLVQTEKMASIGILTTGIAHEINNPLNYISSGVMGLEVEISDLMDSLDELTKNPNEKLSDYQVGILNEIYKKLDLGQEKESIPQLVRAIRAGVDRTTEIVRGLRTFSRMDSNTMHEAQLSEIIESALTILHNKIKNRITLIKNYCPEDRINCFPGKLGQLFLNIIMNAIQAIEGEGTIEIATEKINNGKEYKITISDTGKGMPQTILEKIFDPFFTTKPSGEGTGLGLSIVHGIIKDHFGDIKVFSIEGKGTKFIISLPN
jgi:signal transduction histidine kinase/HAMP domain-containing protein